MPLSNVQYLSAIHISSTRWYFGKTWLNRHTHIQYFRGPEHRLMPNLLLLPSLNQLRQNNTPIRRSRRRSSVLASYGFSASVFGEVNFRGERVRSVFASASHRSAYTAYTHIFTLVAKHKVYDMFLGDVFAVAYRGVLISWKSHTQVHTQTHPIRYIVRSRVPCGKHIGVIGSTNA